MTKLPDDIDPVMREIIERTNGGELSVKMGIEFLDLSADPLEQFRYQWRLENLRGSQKVNVNFD